MKLTAEQIKAMERRNAALAFQRKIQAERERRGLERGK